MTIRGRIAVLAVVVTVASCANLDQPGTPLPAPDRASFPPVADAMQVSCGTLDCHGQIGRNLRLYGSRGLRLDPAGLPDEGSTTDVEYEATYRSIVGLEPETMAQVLADGGRKPEQLAMIRKARHVEEHKGGKQMTAGDPLDTCIVSWLQGMTDAASCKLVYNSLPPAP